MLHEKKTPKDRTKVRKNTVSPAAVVENSFVL